MKVTRCTCGKFPSHIYNEVIAYREKQPIYQGICDTDPVITDPAERGQFRRIPRNANFDIVIL